MIAAAIVCAAAMSQAASVYWTCKEVQQGGSDVSGIAFFVDSAVLSQSAMLALAGSGADAVSTALTTGYTADTKKVGAYSFTGSEGSFAVKSSAAIADATLGLKDGTAYSAYLVIFDTATITDASKFYVTSVEDFTTLSGAEDAQKIGWGSQAEGSAATGAWNAVAAPEPTSSLLLLIGMAGLALRRRRA